MLKLILLIFAKAIITFAFAEPFFDEIKTPVTTEARNPFLVGIGLTLTAALSRDSTGEPLQKDISEDQPLGSWSKFGDLMGLLIPNAVYYGSMKTHFYISKSEESNLNAQIMFKATLYTQLVTQILKYSTRESRPNRKDRKSFPSGHTSSAFAFASSVGAIHGWEWGIPAYAVATFVGISRMNDNAHWLHDVIGGAAIGIGYGLGITYLYKKEKINSDLTIYPILKKDTTGLALNYSF